MLIAVREVFSIKKTADNLVGITVRIAILTGLSQANFQYLTGGIDG